MAKTREDYKDEVKGPGKFEGQQPYVPYFWESYLNGFADEDDGDTLTFDVSEGDRSLFPELGKVDKVFIRADEYGFVSEVDGPNEPDVDELTENQDFERSNEYYGD